MLTNRIFLGFCINRFGIGPLHYISNRSDFGFEFSEIFVLKNDSPTQRYGESATLRINNTRSQRLSDSPTQRLSDSTIRGVDDSPHHWYAESTTPRITDRERQLLNFLKENSLYGWYGESLIRRVADSPYRWVEESTTPRLVIRGISLASIFSTLNGWSMPLKDQFDKN